MALYDLLWICDPTANVGEPPPGWTVSIVEPGEAKPALRAAPYDAVVLDCPLPGREVAEIVEHIQHDAPGIPVLLRDPGATPSLAIRMARLGVRDFIPCGEDPFLFIEPLLAVASSEAADTETHPWSSFLVGRSREMRRISQIIKLVGGRRATVLITGETGTGKELAARALHLAGSRASGPMIAVNCSALPETLLESELFGTMRGAYTGAWQSRAGRFEQANGGTIFLDEIGELTLELQTKLLRVLQEREVQRLGGSELIRLDVRVIAATNCDLPERVARGEFREDLYYRLNVVPLCMPPLRDRTGDVALLARYFVEKICRAESLPVKQLAPEAEARLSEYSWPGNVRQLENCIESAIALSGGRPTLLPPDFPTLIAPRLRVVPHPHPVIAVPHGGLDYEQTLAGIEKSILDQALKMTRGNKKAAADLLKLKRTTLSAKVRSLAFG